MRKIPIFHLFTGRKGYGRALLLIFLIMMLSIVFMYRHEMMGKDNPGGITGFAVASDQQPDHKPIQQVSKDLEDMGAQRVANDPGLRYVK